MTAMTKMKKNASRLLKKNRSPFESLRMNGPQLEMIGRFPFVLSLSKHSDAFFSYLLATAPYR